MQAIERKEVPLMARSPMTLPRDHRVTLATLAAVMAIATLLAFLFLSLARTGVAH
jgi:hypothetical protein